MALRRSRSRDPSSPLSSATSSPVLAPARPSTSMHSATQRSGTYPDEGTNYGAQAARAPGSRRSASRSSGGRSRRSSQTSSTVVLTDPGDTDEEEDGMQGQSGMLMDGNASSRTVGGQYVNGVSSSNNHNRGEEEDVGDDESELTEEQDDDEEDQDGDDGDEDDEEEEEDDEDDGSASIVKAKVELDAAENIDVGREEEQDDEQMDLDDTPDDNSGKQVPMPPISKRSIRIDSTSPSHSASLSPPPPPTSSETRSRPLPKLDQIASPRYRKTLGVGHPTGEEVSDHGEKDESSSEFEFDLPAEMAGMGEEGETVKETLHSMDLLRDMDPNQLDSLGGLRAAVQEADQGMEVDDADLLETNGAALDGLEDPDAADGDLSEAPKPNDDGGLEGAAEEEDAAAAADEEGDHSDSPMSIQPLRPHSTHAPPPTAAAMKALFKLEVKFAALRDKLYLERTQEAAAEEKMLADETHPALTYLYQALSARRVRLHEVASRRHKAALEEHRRVREQEKEGVWTWWTDERDRYHWEEFEQTWSKRRRLAREKNELESARVVKAVPRLNAERKGFDWAAGATPAKLSGSDAANDLAMMSNRPIHRSRHASPFYPESSYPWNNNNNNTRHIHSQPQQTHAQSQAQAQAQTHGQSHAYADYRPAVAVEERQPPPAPLQHQYYPPRVHHLLAQQPQSQHQPQPVSVPLGQSHTQPLPPIQHQHPHQPQHQSQYQSHSQSHMHQPSHSHQQLQAHPHPHNQQPPPQSQSQYASHSSSNMIPQRSHHPFGPYPTHISSATSVVIPRREGRTVPTTSDVFDGGRREAQAAAAAAQAQAQAQAHANAQAQLQAQSQSQSQLQSQGQGQGQGQGRPLTPAMSQHTQSQSQNQAQHGGQQQPSVLMSPNKSSVSAPPPPIGQSSTSNPPGPSNGNGNGVGNGNGNSSANPGPSYASTGTTDYGRQMVQAWRDRMIADNNTSGSSAPSGSGTPQPPPQQQQQQQQQQPSGGLSRPGSAHAISDPEQIARARIGIVNDTRQQQPNASESEKSGYPWPRFNEYGNRSALERSRGVNGNGHGNGTGSGSGEAIGHGGGGGKADGPGKPDTSAEGAEAGTGAGQNGAGKQGVLSPPLGYSSSLGGMFAGRTGYTSQNPSSTVMNGNR